MFFIKTQGDWFLWLTYLIINLINEALYNQRPVTQQWMNKS